MLYTSFAFFFFKSDLYECWILFFPDFYIYSVVIDYYQVHPHSSDDAFQMLSAMIGMWFDVITIHEFIPVPVHFALLHAHVSNVSCEPNKENRTFSNGY